MSVTYLLFLSVCVVSVCTCMWKLDVDAGCLLQPLLFIYSYFMNMGVARV